MKNFWMKIICLIFWTMIIIICQFSKQIKIVIMMCSLWELKVPISLMRIPKTVRLTITLQLKMRVPVIQMT